MTGTAGETRSVGRDVRRFVAVGAIGFVAELLIVGTLVHGFDRDPILSRVLGIAVAVTITYVFNARYTFQMPARDAFLGRYIGVQLFGLGINFGIYSYLILSGLLANWPLIALAIGAMIATFSNFTLSRRFVFTPSRSPSRKYRS